MRPSDPMYGPLSRRAVPCSTFPPLLSPGREARATQSNPAPLLRQREAGGIPEGAGQ
jgi:hypothetical protein